MNELLFFKVWKNIYINKIIFYHSRLLKISKLYKLNEIVAFNRVRALKQFQYRKYIHTIVFCSGEEDEEYGEEEFGSYLPNTLSSIILNNDYYNNRNLNLNSFPISVTCIEGLSFEKRNEVMVIPSNLISLSLSHCPDISNISKWLSFDNSNGDYGNFKELSLAPNWKNGGVNIGYDDFVGFNGITKLLIPSYSGDISFIPDSITHLSIGVRDEQVIYKESIPLNIKSLELNRPISWTKSTRRKCRLSFEKDSIPMSVTHLKLTTFELDLQGLGGMFPNSITSMEIKTDLSSSSFGKIVIEKGVLPSSLKKLIIYSADIKHGALPNSLLELQMINKYWWDDEKSYYEFSVGFFPESLKSLKLDLKLKKQYSLPIGIFPKSTTNLEFGRFFNSIVGLIPENVYSLSIGCNQMVQLDKLPSSIKVLKLLDSFNEVILPGTISNSNIEELSFGGDYPHSIDYQVLPTSLSTLIINSNMKLTDINNIKSKNFIDIFNIDLINY